MRLPAAIVALGLLGVGVPAVQAHPPSPVDRHGRALGGSVHRWLHAAKVPLVKGRVQVVRTGCPGHPNFDGCVFTKRPGRLYLAARLRNPRRLLYHELGHVFDLRVLNNAERRGFKRIMGIRRRGWYGGVLPPAEWFADGYAGCAYRARIRRRQRTSAYGYQPTARQHRRVCLLITRAAEPRGRRPQRPKNPPAVIEAEPPPPPQPTEPGAPSCNPLEQLLTDCSPPASPLGPGLP